MSNAAMAEYWAGPGGQRWLAHQVLLERQLAGVAERLLEVAAPRPGERAIEVGCGTGTLAERIADAIAPGALLAVDISEPLLDLARRNAPGVDFRLADVQSDALPGGHDLAISRFGVMFFEGPEAAFANIRASLRPGGRLCFACWGPVAEVACWSGPLAVATRHLGPPDPVPVGTPGPLSLSDVGRVRAILDAAGFSDVVVRTEIVATRHHSLDDAVTLSLTMGPAGALVTAREADAATVAAIRAEVARDWERYRTPDGASVPALVHFVTALNPG